MNKFKIAIVFIAPLIISSFTANGQNIKKTRFIINPGGVCNSVKSIEDEWMTTLINIESKDHFSNPDKNFLYYQKKIASQQFPRKKSNKPIIKSTQAVNPPIVNTNFNANTSNGSVPLDNYLAVSDSFKIVSVSNTKIQVFDTGGTSLMMKTLSTFTNSLGLVGTGNHKFDPKVIYDPIEDKFITVILNGSSAAYSKVILGFSQTNDPTGAWNFYALPGNPFNDTTWFDYPAINITENEVFITGNQIKENVSWQLGFKQTVIWQIRKRDGYAGNSLVTELWSGIAYNGKNIRNLHPVKWGPMIEGPNQYFLSNRNFDIQNDSIFILEITDTIGSSGAQLNIDVIVSDKKYGVPPSAPQFGGTQYLATNDGRILTGIYQNGKIQFASNSMDTSNGRSAIYFGVINGVDNQSYSIQSTFISNDTLDFGYPNTSWVGDGVNGGQTILSFLHCSEVRRAGISALFYSDGEFSDIITIKEGGGVLNVLADSVERWGDYSGSQPVYNRNGKMWLCGMYANNTNGYATWIAQLDNPFGAETSVNESSNPNFQSSVFPNPSIQEINLKFELPEDISDLSIEIIDIQGRYITQLYRGFAEKGSNYLSFSAENLKSGTYFILLKNKNHQISVHKIIKQ